MYMRKLIIFVLLIINSILQPSSLKKIVGAGVTLGSCKDFCMQVQVGKIYRHYKGNLYKVIALAHDSEKPEMIRVIYEGLYEDPVFGKNPVWDRPYTMFIEKGLFEGKEQQRFTEVE
ncbi:MAG: DUF1653 domain-containing protein [Candidatus Chromulinivorax sp.]